MYIWRNRTKPRLNTLKQQKYQTHRIFQRISENMHYEIFKYVDSITLLQIRTLGLGGYQLTSNPILRPRIKINKPWKIYIQNSGDLTFANYGVDVRRLKFMMLQTGNSSLSFRDLRLLDDDIYYICKVLVRIPHILELNLGIYK